MSERWFLASAPPADGSIVQATDLQRVYPAKWTGEEWLDLSSELVNDPIEDTVLWAPLMSVPDMGAYLEKIK